MSLAKMKAILNFVYFGGPTFKTGAEPAIIRRSRRLFWEFYGYRR